VKRKDLTFLMTVHIRYVSLALKLKRFNQKKGLMLFIALYAMTQKKSRKFLRVSKIGFSYKP
jgi:hypothetical protein